MTGDIPGTEPIVISTLMQRANRDSQIARWGRGLSTRFLLDLGIEAYLIDIVDGQVRAVSAGPFVMPSWDFALRAPAQEWQAFWQAKPLPGHHDLFAMIKRRVLKAEGNLQPFMAHLIFFKALLASLRPEGMPAATAATVTTAAVAVSNDGQKFIGAQNARFEPVTGRYLNCTLLGQSHRVYIEESGQGIPLLCLHTAGADSRQYRAVQNDAQILEHFRVIAFDLPWHGKSSPPAGWQLGDYQLSSRNYMDLVLGLSQALGLDRPVVMGCSIGGRIVLHLALDHPQHFRAAIGLQAGAHVDPYYDLAWLHDRNTHGGEVCAGVVSGLIGPDAADEHRWETLWHYMQGGPGVFKGDLHFYKFDGDIRDRVAAIDTRLCPLYLLSGEYDYSCTPQDTHAVAASVAGAKATIMSGLGHFPMSEDPQKFLLYLRPVLDEIRA